MLNGPILALDADLDVYAVVTYQLLGAESGLFDIDNSTGEASAHPPHPQLGSTSPSWGGSEPTAGSRASLLSAGLGLYGFPIPQSWIRAPGGQVRRPRRRLGDNTRDLLVHKFPAKAESPQPTPSTSPSPGRRLRPLVSQKQPKVCTQSRPKAPQRPCHISLVIDNRPIW